MNIQVIRPLMYKREESGLYEYRYVNSKGEFISPVFQATLRVIKVLRSK